MTRRFEKVPHGFGSGARHIEFGPDDPVGWLVWPDGSRWRSNWGTTVEDAERFVRQGLWREIVNDEH